MQKKNRMVSVAMRELVCGRVNAMYGKMMCEILGKRKIAVRSSFSYLNVKRDKIYGSWYRYIFPADVY